MAQTEVLTKILHIREQEEKDAQIAHHQSVAFFEKLATQLYQLLRKKEDAEATYEQTIKNPTSIDEIKDQLTYIESLNKQIIHLQNEVNQARQQMEQKQQELTSAHVEVKKFETLIEKRRDAQKALTLKLEQESMDEVSSRQYVEQIHKNNGENK